MPWVGLGWLIINGSVILMISYVSKHCNRRSSFSLITTTTLRHRHICLSFIDNKSSISKITNLITGRHKTGTQRPESASKTHALLGHTFICLLADLFIPSWLQQIFTISPKDGWNGKGENEALTKIRGAQSLQSFAFIKAHETYPGSIEERKVSCKWGNASQRRRCLGTLRQEYRQKVLCFEVERQKALWISSVNFTRPMDNHATGGIQRWGPSVGTVRIPTALGYSCLELFTPVLHHSSDSYSPHIFSNKVPLWPI